MAEEIRAEMVANVWKVVAAAGDAVAAGDTLVILESMKMEIPVLAEEGGTARRAGRQRGRRGAGRRPDRPARLARLSDSRWTVQLLWDPSRRRP